MTEAEQTYVQQFRALHAKKKEIAGMIAGLERICGSLKTWEKTAEEISGHGSETTRPEWSEDRLKNLLTIRSLLREYHRQANELRVTWSRLDDDQKIGLQDPASISRANPV